MNVRTRIAPSPTGQLHIGHIRTSLYNFAYAKKNNGEFILRIEDTDRERYIEGAIDTILDLHEYLGLIPAEGQRQGGPYAPYIQSQRLEIYKKHAEELIANSHAYYCFCSEERLEQLRNQQKSQGMAATKYDKNCLKLSEAEVKQKLDNGEKFVIRMNIPADEIVTWRDEVLGEISVPTNDIDDQVLIKSDGFPTYHLAVVVDDHLMDITHILRGNDWIPSTPKHILLYKFFSWNLPRFVHLPNLREKDGTRKLSKRFGSVSLLEFLEEGYLPEALLNFLMFLGWNPGNDKEIFTLNEFIKEFSLERIQKSDLVSFDREKLIWINGHYIRSIKTEDLWNIILSWSKKFNYDIHTADLGKDTNIKILELVKERIKKLSEFNLLTEFFVKEPEVSKDKLLEYAKEPQIVKEIISLFINKYHEIPDEEWTKEKLDKISHDLLSELNLGTKEVFMTLRIAVTGQKATPPLFDVFELMGKKVILSRLNKSLSKLD